MDEREVEVGGWRVQLSVQTLAQEVEGGNVPTLSVRVLGAAGHAAATILLPSCPPSSLKQKRHDDVDDSCPGDKDEQQAPLKKQKRRRGSTYTVPSTASVMDLPIELQMEVLRWMPVDSLVRQVPLVCRGWRTLALDLSLWQHLHRRLLGVDPATSSTNSRGGEKDERSAERELDAFHGGASGQGDDVEQEKEEEEEEEERKAYVEQLQRALMWAVQQDKESDDEAERMKWKLAEKKWSKRLRWAALNGYTEPARQSLTELGRLAACPPPPPTTTIASSQSQGFPLQGRGGGGGYKALGRQRPGQGFGLGLRYFEDDLLGGSGGDVSFDLLERMHGAAMAAAEHGQAAVLQLLLDHGAELDEALFDKGVLGGVPEVVRLLLARAPEPLLAARCADVAFQLAIVPDVETLDLMLELHYIDLKLYNLVLNCGLVQAVRLNDLEGTRALLSAGASPNTQTRDGGKPLLLKAVAQGAPMVRLLLDYGARTAAKGGWRLPLERAIQRCDVAVVEVLCAYGAAAELDVDSIPAFTGTAFRDCMVVVQRAKRDCFFNSLKP